MDLEGEFRTTLRSDYNYYRGSEITIDCVRYDIYKRIIDAIAPILEEEKELIKKEKGDKA